MSENFDGHKDLPRPEGSTVDENTIQQQYTMPVDQYSFQPNTFSLFIPSNVFANSGNTFNPSINNNLPLNVPPLTTSMNTSNMGGMHVDNQLPGISFSNYVTNLDPSITSHNHSLSGSAPSNPFMLSQDNNNGNNNTRNLQENPNTINYNNNNNNNNSRDYGNAHPHQLNYCSTSNNTTGSANITSDDSSFSNPEGWKARSGERDDIPNPRKVVEILRELERSQQEMNALRETFVTLPNAKRERNRVASRTCRLKKKAVYEINKIKVFHLDTEYRALCNIVKEISSFILANCSIPSYGNFYTNFYQTTKKKYLPGRMVTGNLEMLIDEVLRTFASGENIDYYSLASSNKKL